jgi:rhodanese-related sulfurtransferase
MRRVLLEALQVTAAGLLLGGAAIVTRGLPAPRPSEDTATCSAPDPATPTIRWMPRTEAHALIEDPSVVFVDARERAAFESGHVEGALSLAFDGATVPEPMLAMLRGARLVVTYCDTAGGCATSTRLARALVDAGLTDVRVLEGGMPGWLESGYAAEAGPCRSCP